MMRAIVQMSTIVAPQGTRGRRAPVRRHMVPAMPKTTGTPRNSCKIDPGKMTVTLHRRRKEREGRGRLHPCRRSKA